MLPRTISSLELNQWHYCKPKHRKHIHKPDPKGQSLQF